MDDLLADFLTETNEGLIALDAALLRLERTPDDHPTLSEIFRLVHTIKGTCGFLGLARLEKVAHAAENVLGRYRDGSLAVTQDGISLILRALDCIKAIVAGLEASGAEPPGDDEALIAALNAAAEGEAVAPPAPASAAAVPAAATPAAGSEAAACAPGDAEDESADATSPPPPPSAVPVAAEPAAAPGPVPPRSATEEATPSPGAAAGGAPPQTIRVSVEVLEDLMMLVSELVLTRNQLLQLARAKGDSALTVPLQRLSHITSDLQEGVMKTRMQPIGNAWAKLPRLVRDLGLELGKKIALETRGAETELDRQVLELIRDPLTHMVRNSADHGIESPEERRAAGKPETGRIMLNACHEGGQIVIEIGDDGRGLPVEKIRAKALAQGLATEAELAQMSEREILRFIFRPGFSTASQVTAVSGRGVGMDVVRANVERIGGTIDLRSREGQGTTFTIKIPLTLAIVSALIVEAAGERFAIPQIGVVELVRVGGGAGADNQAPRLERIKDAPVLRLRDRLLPLVSLADLLRLERPQAAGEDGAATAAEGGFVVVTQVGAHVFGIIVDRVFDTEEIVVKPVAPILRHVTMFSGNTILGDGSVIMILDPNGIARATGVAGDGAGEESGAGGAAAEDAAGLGATVALRSDAKTAMLLFRAGGEATPKAVPLGLVARLEDIPRERIELSGGMPVVQYRGQLMPLVPLSADGGGGWSPEAAQSGGRQAVLVFNDRDRAMGLMVDEILDVIEEPLLIERGPSQRPGYLGSAVLQGKVTDVIDTAWWLRQAGDDWFAAPPAAAEGGARRGAGPRLLLVEDSAFFRHLVVPALAAAGYAVTAVETPLQALKLREAGAMFEAIVSDIEMPEMDGFAFAQAVREGGGPWARLPMIALTARADPADAARGRAAGFTDYVGKYDREALLASLRECLAPPVALAWAADPPAEEKRAA